MRGQLRRSINRREFFSGGKKIPVAIERRASLVFTSPRVLCIFLFFIDKLTGINLRN